MNYKNIETRYNGVNFRSRLEARWAAFFDMLEWKWSYEPFDLNGWIPDFFIEQTLLIEVKPIVFQTNPSDQFKKLPDDLKKCEYTVMNGKEVLIVGIEPISIENCGAYPADDYTNSCIGMLLTPGFSEPTTLEDSYMIDDGLLKDTTFGKIDIGGNFGLWSGRFFDGPFKCRSHKIPSISYDDTKYLWRQAGNKVQWHKRLQA